MAMPYYRKKKDAAEQSFKNGWDLLNQRNTQQLIFLYGNLYESQIHSLDHANRVADRVQVSLVLLIHLALFIVAKTNKK